MSKEPPSDTGMAVRLAPGVSSFSSEEWNALGGADNPFVSHEFLSALEDSGSVGSGTGWEPSPTPATGPRLLLNDDALAPYLLKGAELVCEQNGLSSAHATFIDPAQFPLFEEAGWLIRSDIQFHWENRQYAQFDDFLARLTSRKRKDLRKERRAAQEGIEIVRLSGDDIREEHWDIFWVFYQDTGARKWGTPYLTREAFSLFSQRMADQLVLILALDNGARGYAPVKTYSAHWIANPSFRAAIEDFLEREGDSVSADQIFLDQRTPFKKD